MSDQPWDAPNVALNRSHAHDGDQGETSLAGGRRVAKDGARIDACGAVEELNTFVGSARALAEEITDRNGKVWPLVPILLRVQHELFDLQSLLATPPEDVHPRQTSVILADVARLEHEIDRAIPDLPPLRSYVLPGSGSLNAALHQCCAICRRAERVTVSLARQELVPREVIQYLNRLGGAFFVWSRWASHLCGEGESLWDPSHPAFRH
jgi:cob(I)alamin adenosyltransferase